MIKKMVIFNADMFCSGSHFGQRSSSRVPALSSNIVDVVVGDSHLGR